jgi:glutathione S-transferase
MLILHHYSLSPFSEKIRLMLGYAGMPWQSLASP